MFNLNIKFDFFCSSSFKNKTGTAIDIKDWREGLVVCFSSGQNRGGLGILRSKQLRDGTFDVIPHDKRDQSRGVFNVKPHEITLAEPTKGSQVMVLAGAKKLNRGVALVNYYHYYYYCYYYYYFTIYKLINIYFYLIPPAPAPALIQRVISGDVFLESKEMIKLSQVAWFEDV